MRCCDRCLVAATAPPLLPGLRLSRGQQRRTAVARASSVHAAPAAGSRPRTASPALKHCSDRPRSASIESTASDIGDGDCPPRREPCAQAAAARPCRPTAAHACYPAPFRSPAPPSNTRLRRGCHNSQYGKMFLQQTGTTVVCWTLCGRTAAAACFSRTTRRVKTLFTPPSISFPWCIGHNPTICRPSICASIGFFEGAWPSR